MASKLSPSYITRKLLTNPYWNHGDTESVSLQQSARHALAAVDKLAGSCASLSPPIADAVIRLRAATEAFLTYLDGPVTNEESDKWTATGGALVPASGAACEEEPERKPVPEPGPPAAGHETIVPDQEFSPVKPWVAPSRRQRNRYKG